MSRRVEERGPPSIGRALRQMTLNTVQRVRPSRPFPQLESHGIATDRQQVERYLGATDGARLACFRPEADLVPPVLPALWEVPLALELFALAGDPLPRRGIIHVGSERLFVRPLHLDDALRCRVAVEREASDPSGTRRTLLCRSFSGAGHLCSESRLEFLVEPRRGEGADDGAPKDGDFGPQGEGWTELKRWGLRGSQGRRYARAAGDYNPIHLWRLTSRLFGYRRPILHGLCLEAMVAHALIEGPLLGDPQLLRRLRITFRRPVLLPAELRLLVQQGERGGRFVVRGEDAKMVALGEWGGALQGGEPRRAE
jgi:acyl dehydratase